MGKTSITLKRNAPYIVKEQSCIYIGRQENQTAGTLFLFQKKNSREVLCLTCNQLGGIRVPRVYKHRFRLVPNAVKYGNKRMTSKREIYDYAVNALKLKGETIWQLMESSKSIDIFVGKLNEVLNANG